MARKKTRRQAHSSAWYWKQTGCWYYTLAGTRRRVALFDEDSQRIRGLENKQPAQLALARVRLAAEGPQPAAPAEAGDWLVARVCSEYLQYCSRGVAAGTVSAGHHENSRWILNDLCKHCGALPAAQLKKAHLETWIGQRPRWRSPATQRSVLTVVLAAFNHAAANHDLPHGLKGLKKPAAR